MKPIYNSWSLALAAVVLAGCSNEGPADPLAPGRVEFLLQDLTLGLDRAATLTLMNPGQMAIGPVSLTASPIVNAGGASLPGASVVLTPGEISTLNPGESRTVDLEIEIVGTIQPGRYGASVRARAPDGGDGIGPVEDRIAVDFEIAPFEGVQGVASVRILSPHTQVRQGDALGFTVVVESEDGTTFESVPVGWSTSPPSSGYMAAGGEFVGYSPGETRIIARVGEVADTVVLTISSRGLSGTIPRIGEGSQADRRSSDLWVHGDFAYVGTHVGGAGGNTMFVWDVSDPTAPFKTDSVAIDARVVNDVKVRSDGRLAVITHEGSNDGLNGITLLDLDDPAHPSVVGRFTERLESGVHNAWIEGGYVYLVADGSGVGLRILDISDPGSPVVVATFSGSSGTFLHDVYVRDGLAFLSHWDAGLIVLDVGNGIAGGSPSLPVEVSRIRTTGGQTHNAWYWPQTGYVFVGEEDFATPGVMHVVDFRDPTHPREVATFSVPDQTPHNFWLDEDRGVLYLAWYGNGVRVLDVTGELTGELEKQGREITFALHRGPGGCSGSATCTWAPQLHRGLVFVSDLTGGLSVLDPVF